MHSVGISAKVAHVCYAQSGPAKASCVCKEAVGIGLLKLICSTEESLYLLPTDLTLCPSCTMDSVCLRRGKMSSVFEPWFPYL